jgi:hypothetical protein
VTKKPIASSSSPVTAPKKSWREILFVHKAADEFPLLSETDPAALKRDHADDIGRAVADNVSEHKFRNIVKAATERYRAKQKPAG